MTRPPSRPLGQRYGADGDGYSIYLKDPEGTVVELKSGN